MKQLSLVFTMVLLTCQFAVAQRTITGTVTDNSTGSALINANVSVEGTDVGVVTDVDGKYSINVPEGATVLIFSYIGYTELKKTLGTSNVLDIGLTEGVLSEGIVVTGLNIKRSEKSLGYSVQQVGGEDLNLAGEDNVVTSLSGKVAGVQVVSASGAQLGGSAKIRIRGATGLGGGDPLFVVDGTPMSDANFSGNYNDYGGSTGFDEVSREGQYRGTDFGNIIQDINPDDIESVSVLKGPAATAIYGERGKNGVVMITTKTGNGGKKGLGINVSSSISTQNVYVMPTYQNEYAGGYTQDFLTATDPVDGQTYDVLNYGADESWGPKINGQTYRPWWSWYPGTSDYGQTTTLTAQPDNVESFFNTGVTYNNNISITNNSDKLSFRLSYNNTQQTGIIPNSSLNKNNLSLNASSNITDRLKVSASVNMGNTQGKGRPKFGYTGNNVTQQFNQWFQRQLDMDRLRDYKNADGTFRSWNIRSATNTRPLYWDSPFFSVMENFSTDSRDRLFGNINLTYQIAKGLSVSGAVRRDEYVQRIEDRIATGGLDPDFYSEFVANGREDNYEAIVSYNTNFSSDITFDANLGGNIRNNTTRQNFMGTIGGLNSPNLYNIAASTDRPVTYNLISNKEVRSVFGTANIGYKSFLYLNGTFRNDWSSALPTDNNSYLYGSGSFSFVFSELIQNDILSYGKLRLSAAQVGSDINPYQTNFTYSSGTPFGTTSAFTLPNTLVNNELKPSISTSYEIGTDLRFFQDRLGLDFTYYVNNATDEILELQVPGSSGFEAALVNAGNIKSSGIELALTATPVKTAGFTWTTSFNIARNTSEVIELSDGLDNYLLDNWGWGGFSVNAPVGGEWGMMRGTAFKRDANDNFIIDEDGSFVTELDQDLGSFLPDATGGWQNVFSYKGIELAAFIDFQIGGQFHSVTKMFNAYSGLSEETVGNNDKGNPVRDAVADGGGVKVEGVLADGTAKTVYVEAIDYYAGLFALNERWIYDASFIKLRELRVAYSLPKSIIGKLPVSSASIAITGNNVWLISSKVDGIDPSEISPGRSNFVFQENGILPSVRSWGINLKVGF